MNSSDVYLLPRDASETIRLNLQHQIYKKTLGYLLHPNIPIKEGIRIADVGCGTGVFILDLAQTLPATLKPQLIGFDISSAQFPSPGKLPPSVTLQTHNIHDPFPSALQSTFDVVHLRLVGQVFHTPAQRDSAIANVILLLKPGGWIQWTEPDHLIQARVVSGHPAPALQALYDFTIRKQKDLEWDIETNFAIGVRGFLVDSGSLGEVEEVVVPIDRCEEREVRAMVQTNSLGIFRAALMSYLESGRQDEVLGLKSVEGVDELLGEVKAEMQRGAVYRYFWHSVIARKI